MPRPILPRSVAAAGDADPDLAWERYADLDRWPSWAPPIRSVEADGRALRAGLAGVVHGPAGLRIPFEVLGVDPDTRTWRWRVRVGPTRIEMTHEVIARPDGGVVATLRVGGPVWTSAYLPVARIALARLVAE